MRRKMAWCCGLVPVRYYDDIIIILGWILFCFQVFPFLRRKKNAHEMEERRTSKLSKSFIYSMPLCVFGKGKKINAVKFMIDVKTKIVILYERLVMKNYVASSECLHSPFIFVSPLFIEYSKDTANRFLSYCCSIFYF